MNSEGSEDKGSYISRIPWKTYLRSIFIKIIALMVIATFFLLIMYYSSLITPDAKIENPNNVIGFDSGTFIALIVVSSTLFLLVLGSFVKTLFIDHKEEFGFDSLKSQKTIILGLLIVAFISSIYLLLDVALKNIYLTTGPVTIVWILDNNLGFDIPNIDTSVDRLAYSEIRTYYFFIFYIIMLIFPVIMFFLLLTRFGRNRIFRKDEKDKLEKERGIEDKAFNALGILFAPILILFLISVLLNPEISGFTSNMLSISILGLIVWWVYQIIMLILKGIKLGAFLSYANLIIFFPLIFLFYFLPIILWTGWDLLKIFSMNGSTLETIHTEMATPLANTIIDLANLSTDGLINLIVQTATVNSIAVFRIIQLDFVFIVGISAVAIGFAEGYAIISIFRALFKGASVARTGRIARRSAPKMVILASRLIMIGAWLSFFWDRITITIEIIKEEFAIYFPWIIDIKIPRIFDFIFNFDFIFDLGFIILPLTPFVIVLYYILMSAFKFLSVSLIVDKAKGDIQIFYLLISSAFVLITTNILQDITETVLLKDSLTGGSDKRFLPTAFIREGFFSFANKLFETMESLAFYIGVMYALFLLLRMLIRKYIIKEHKPSYLPN